MRPRNSSASGTSRRSTASKTRDRLSPVLTYSVSVLSGSALAHEECLYAATLPGPLTNIFPCLKRWSATCLCTLGILAYTPMLIAAGEKSVIADIAFEECSIGSGAASLVAQCANISVPLDYSDIVVGDQSPDETAQSEFLDIAIARIPARRRSDRQDAFTLIAGGPGQSAIESFPAVSFAFRHIMRDHDVILIDQRGTGESARLNCPEDPGSMGLELDTDAQTISLRAVECRKSLPHDPDLFTTSVAVQDLEFVREALDISQWNLYGISYGTRVALHYLRRYPDAVRTMTLDAVVPPSVALGPEIGPLAQRTLDLIFQRCRDDAGCFEAFGDLSEPTLALLDSLAIEPRDIIFEDVVTGKLTDMTFTREHLAITLRLMSYSSQTAAILPSMLHEAIVDENFAPLARQSLLQTRALGDTMSTGMHQAIICTEDAPFVSAEPLSAESAGYLGDDIISALLASCSQWPAGQIDEDFKQPVVSSVPTLILSGEADPITPPEYGDRVAQHLSESRHIVNPGQGHMQAPFGCMPVLLAKFVDTADAINLDSQCLQRLRTLPFFVDANGPLP